MDAFVGYVEVDSQPCSCRWVVAADMPARYTANGVVLAYFA